MNIEGLEIRVKYRITTYWKDGILVGKKCTKCGENKDISEFAFRDKKGGSYLSYCKKCNCEKAKKWNENNKEHKKKRDKEWNENNPEYKKQYRKDIKEDNLKEISKLLEQINPIFKQLKLPAYGYIYKFENIKTGKVYIGQTIRPLKVRYKANIIQGWIEDRKHYANQKFKDELIEENIIITELFDVAFCQYHLDKLEAYWINHYDSCKNGYNNKNGNHNTDDGLEEFESILEKNNLEYKEGKITKKERLPKQA